MSFASEYMGPASADSFVLQRSQGKRQKVTHDDRPLPAALPSSCRRRRRLATGSDSGTQNGGDIIVHTTFGLEKEAETWLRDELQRSQDSYLRQPPAYTPLQCKQDGKIPLKHMQEALAEFARRFGSSPSSDKTPSVLLVATGVSEDWVPGDDVGRARFLFFSETGFIQQDSIIHHLHAWACA
jgi:hypothetical protein